MTRKEARLRSLPSPPAQRGLLAWLRGNLFNTWYNALLTFGALRWVFRTDASMFQTVWFVISLLTELVVVLVLRTRRLSWKSRPGKLLIGGYLRVGPEIGDAANENWVARGEHELLRGRRERLALWRRHLKNLWQIRTRRRRRPHNLGLNMSLARADLEELIERRPEIARQIIRVLTRRLRDANQRMARP